MSIAGIINSATTGLLTAQARISLTSTNIDNAQTDGYTKKTAYVGTTATGGQVTGVTVIGSGNDVDEKIFKKVMEAASEASYTSVLSSYYETLVSSLGTTKDGSDISETLGDLITSLSTMISDPGATNAGSNIIDAVGNWANAISTLSDTIQSTRTTADAGIADAVEQVNDLLDQIDGLNDRIVALKVQGESTADLEDTRRVALQNLSQYIDVTTFDTTTGETYIYTNSGKALLTGSVHELSYTASGFLSDSSAYPGSIPGIVSDGTDVTSDLTGGSIAALVKVRDDTLPGLQDELDGLVKTVTTSLNDIANTGTQVPPATKLTSDATWSATSAVVSSTSGSVTVQVVDASGNLTTHTLSWTGGSTTVANIISTLSSYGLSASLGSDGRLAVSSTYGVAIATDGSSAANVFGFNNLFSGSTAATVQVKDTLSTQGLVSAAVNASATTNYTDASSTGVLKSLWSALEANMSFSAAGGLDATTTTVTSYISALIDDWSDRAETASSTADGAETTSSTLSTSFSDTYGVNVTEETALLTTYQQDYQACAQILSTAQEMWNTLISMMN